MTFLAINWLNISIDLLLVVFVIVCLLMTLVILMQRPKQEGLGAAFGGGVTDQVFGARTTNVLQRGTVYLGSMFFVLSLLLAVLIGQQNRITSTVTAADSAPAKVEEAKPAVEEAPKSLSEELPPADTAPVQTPAPAEVPADASTAPAETAPVAPAEEAPPASEATPVTPPTEEQAPEAPPAAPEGETSGSEKTGE